MDDLNAELSVAKRSRQRQATKEKFTRHLKRIKLNAFVNVELRVLHVKGETTTIRTYQATVVVDEQTKRHTQRLDGFWLLVTNHIEKAGHRDKLSAKDAIGPYREKVVIESAFRDIKSFVEVKPVYVWTPAHVKAHYTCCALSHLINRTLTLRLHEKPGDVSKDVVAHERLYEEFVDCKVDRIEVPNARLSTYKITRTDDVQKELLERLQLTKLLSSAFLKKVNPQYCA